MTEGPSRTEGSSFTVRIVTGGTPTAAEEAALVVAVDRVITARDRRRATPPPLWGVVGRLEARDGRTVRSRAALPRDATPSPSASPEYGSTAR